jgi:PAS domain S-box-containing protein
LAYSIVATAGYAGTAWYVHRKLGQAPIPKNRRQGFLLFAASAVAPVAGAFAAAVAAQTGPMPALGPFWLEVAYRWIGAVGTILSIVPAAVIFVGPSFISGRTRPRLPPGAKAKAEMVAQAVFIATAIYLTIGWGPLRKLHVFSLSFVPLVWIVLGRGLSGAAAAVLGINLGTCLGLSLIGPSTSTAANFLIYAIARSATGLGLGIVVDKRDEAEAALAKSQRRLAQVMTGARLGLWNIDLIERTCEYDERYAQMIGFSLEELSTDQDWWESRVHSDDISSVRSLSNEHLAGRSPHFEAEFRVMTKDGRWKWIHSRGAVIERAADGTPLRMAGTHLDLTDRKEAENEKNRLLNIIEASTDFIGSADLDHRLLYQNPAFRKFLGIAHPSEVRNFKVGDCHPEWARKKIIEEAMPVVLAQGSWLGENAMLDAQGREVPVSQLIFLQKNDAGAPESISTIARDISRQKELESMRLATERKILQAQKLESLGVLAGGIAHDFNNLLTAMLGNASLAALDLPEASPTHAFIQNIRKAALRAAELCKQMLAYSGKSRLSAAPVDITSIVLETKPLLQVSISKKCVLIFELAGDLPHVEADSGQIRQVLVNLVINASDAIGERSGTIRVSTGLSRRESADPESPNVSPGLPPGDYVCLEVGDDGSGMTAEVRAHIFEPFFTTKFAGRGLGLPAALGIVRGHRGSIGVDTEPGRGTMVRVYLPALDSAARAETSAPAPKSASAPRRGTILVVDDEETVRTVAARLLERAGFSTVLASDGRRALEIFKAQPRAFVGVLLDLTMPHMNGEETFRELRRIDSRIPVIVMSGFSEQDSHDRFAGGDLSGFVAKPFDRDSLLAKVLPLFCSKDNPEPKA